MSGGYIFHLIYYSHLHDALVMHVHAGKLVMNVLCICKFRINELIIKMS